MKKILVVDPFSGVSGDMFVASLLGVGVSLDAIRKSVLAIPELSEVSVSERTVTRGVFEAVQVTVDCPEEHHHRSLSTIRDIIDRADLPASVKEGSKKTFELLAAAEAKVHGQDIETVHFHEVGALDAIFDIVAAHMGLNLLGEPDGFTMPIALGSGSTSSAHGTIPIPAPASIELLAGFPVKFTGQDHELVTPTGAAIIASRFKPLPTDMMVTPDRTAYGAGTRDHEGLPNVLRTMIGEADTAETDVCIVTSTIDDMNPEVYGYVMEKLFANGALDVYYNAIMMKKNRPGVEITMICEEDALKRLADILLSETTTLGIRINREQRAELRRHRDTVDTEYGPIAVKVAERPTGGHTVSPEYESCKEASERTQAPLITVYNAAIKAWDSNRNK